MSRVRVRESLYCANALIAARRHCGQPIPEWLRQHHAQLTTEWRMSESGHESHCGERQLEEHDELITTSEAAEILGMSRRQAQRLSADLGGRIVGATWVFSKSSVIEYAEERSAGHPRGR
jgi:hypothetical protein